MPDRLTEERIARNETLFREVNERVKELVPSEGGIDFICECGNEECDQSLFVSAAEYEEIRSDARLFAMAPGHEFEAVEEVVAVRKGFNVVKKRLGTPARVAQETDPRSD